MFLHKQLKTAVVIYFCLSLHNPDLRRQPGLSPSTPSSPAERRLGVHARWEDAGSFPSLISRSQLHNVAAKTHSQDHKPLCTRSRPERDPLCVLESIKEGLRGSDVKTVCRRVENKARRRVLLEKGPGGHSRRRGEKERLWKAVHRPTLLHTCVSKEVYIAARS